MNRFLFALIPISAAILSSCSSVTTQTPVANETEISLQADFTGSWKLDDGIVHVAFDEDGIGRFASTYWEDNEFITARGKFNAIRTKNDGEKGFISIQVEEDGDDKTYEFCAFKLIEEDQVLIWKTNSVSKFEPFLANNKMVGEIKRHKFGGDSILFMDGAELATKVDDFGKYFDLEGPMILTRVIPKKAPEPAPDDEPAAEEE